MITDIKDLVGFIGEIRPMVLAFLFILITWGVCGGSAVLLNAWICA